MEFQLIKTTPKSVYSTIENIIAPLICGKYELLRTPNGKPYIEGSPLHFSITHSGNIAFIATANVPVGVDFELIRERNITATLNRFTVREKNYIANRLEKFYENWVAKEAFIKMLGQTLATHLKRLEYFDGKLYSDGIRQYVSIRHISGGICAVCLKHSEEKL